VSSGCDCRSLDLRNQLALLSVSRWSRPRLSYVSLYDTSLQVIRSFKDAATEAAFHGEVGKGFPADLVKVTRRKLRYLHAAKTLDDLRAPPGNRLETLKGDRAGQCSIRVNDQFRICFVWTPDGPEAVEFTDYH
jgi:proteic killer suppression protein